MVYLLYFRAFLHCNRGEISMGTAIGCLVLLVAYMAFPGAFHAFFHYIQNMVFDALRSSFGNDPLNNPPQRKGNAPAEVFPNRKKR